MRKTLNILTIISIALVFVLGYVCLARAGTTIDIGASTRIANVDSESMNVAVKHTTGDFTASGSMDYSEREGDRTGEDYSGFVGYDPHLSGSWSLWSYLKASKDYTQGIRLATQGGGGLKYDFSSSAALSLSLSAGPVVDYTDYAGIDDDPSCRLSVRPKVDYASGPWEIQGVAYYQPSVEDLRKDYILDGSASVRYAFNDTWGLKVTAQDTYRSLTPCDENNDLRGSVALSVRF